MRTIQHILVPIDFSEASEPAVSLAVEGARTFAAHHAAACLVDHGRRLSGWRELAHASMDGWQRSPRSQTLSRAS